MVLRPVERAKKYHCYNKELPNMRTSWPEIPGSVLALIPVSTINRGTTTTSRYCYPILAEISSQRIPPLEVGGAQSSLIGSTKRETLALGDRLTDVEALGGFHPATGLRRRSRILGK